MDTNNGLPQTELINEPITLQDGILFPRGVTDTDKSPNLPSEKNSDECFVPEDTEGEIGYESFDNSEDDPDYDPTKEKENRPLFNLLITPKRKDRYREKTDFVDNLVSPSVNNRTIQSDYTSSDRYLESEAISPISTLSRKRKRQQELWKQNIRKKLRELGKNYTNIKGKHFEERKVGAACPISCFYQCSKIFSEDNRITIHSAFWNLPDSSKNTFYGQFVKKESVNRRRQAVDLSKRKFTYHYYLKCGDTHHRVCKTFFLNTLNIGERRIYYYFDNMHCDGTGAPRLSRKGKNVKRSTPPEKIDEVKAHISSFPTVDSHYCRANTQKKYLETGMSLNKMYSLYREKTSDPVSLAIYSKIVNYSFNLSFYKPKKDRCDRCVLFEINNDPTEKQRREHEEHREENKFTKVERTIDRQNRDSSTAIICYDLQNVFSLPRGYASNYYYKRKLSVFNLTGICNLNKITYCAIWNEAFSGRTGNDIASALIKILQAVLSDIPTVKDIILSSDSCVPQNRNQITSVAILQFLHDNPIINSVQQKFSETGHFQIQEIDSVHSAMDRYLKGLEIHSQLSLFRLLKDMKYDVSLKLLQMQNDDFKTYSAKSQKLNFQSVPYSKCKNLYYYSEDLFTIIYKTSMRARDFCPVFLRQRPRKGNLGTPNNLFQQKSTVLDIRKKISAEKKKDIKSMLPFMPEVEKLFYQALLKFWERYFILSMRLFIILYFKSA